MPAHQYIRTVDLCRYYRRGKHEVRALDHVSLTVDRGEFLSIVGSSGSGKTTLLNLLAGLDTPTSGIVEFDASPLSSLSRRQLAAYRAHKVGMIFQSFNLISHYTALQNVETALYFNGTPAAERQRRATEMLEQLGMSNRLTHRPADLSGGEQQRVAVARAIVKKPEILFADEPTGNLDYENAQHITSLLTKFNSTGLTIVLVTHNVEMAQQFTHRAIRMQYGHVVGGDPIVQSGGHST
jgi:putative ABC transport system ATP-binding protein